MNNTTEKKEEILSLTADIVAAHVSNNSVPAEDLTDLVQQVYNTLSVIDRQATLASENLSPAIPVEDSIQPDYIVCLEDGRKLQMLKRHLRRAYNLTPDQYRQRWGLKANYPMVAPNYSKKRSDLAKDFGLGVKRTKS